MVKTSKDSRGTGKVVHAGGVLATVIKLNGAEHSAYGFKMSHRSHKGLVGV